MIIGTMSVFREAEYRRKSRQLDLLALDDFGPIRDELKVTFPNTDLPVRAIPFVVRYLAELSGHYAFPVVREFGPADLAPATQDQLAELYEASRIDEAMAAAENSLWTQNVAVLLPLPDGMGKVRLQLLLPWQIDRIETSDPMRADDPKVWTRLVAQVPASDAAGQVTMGELEVTPATATRQLGGNKVGLYAADHSNPFGRIPVAVAYRVRPDVGRPLPPLNEPVLNLQVALCLQQADNELIVRSCAWPQKWIRNATVAQLVETIVNGPDKFMAMVRSGDPQAPSPELAIAQGQVPVAELVSFAEHQIRLYCSMLGLDPAAFLRVNTAVTAAARLFSMQDRRGQRSKIEPVLGRLERDALELVVELQVLRGEMVKPAKTTVSATWHTVFPSPNQQTEAQAQQARIDLDLESRSEIVARERGVSPKRAREIVEANARERKEFAKPPPPPPFVPKPPPGQGDAGAGQDDGEGKTDDQDDEDDVDDTEAAA
jgi:hypothetical protein